MINKTTQQNISEEWKEDVFGSLYDEPSRNGLSKPSSVRGVGYKMVNMGELFRHECITEDTEMELVPLTESEKKISFLKAGDLLFARQSLVLSGVGKCVYFSALTNDITFESHIIRVRLKDKISYSKFYFYYFQSALGKSRVMAKASMLAAAGIRGSDLQKLKVPIPKYQEQERVVIVLDTWDQAIEKLKQKIEVKKEIKKGLMQELLTGKKRLIGFIDSWKHKKIGEICKTSSGGTPKADNESYYLNGDIPWLNSGEVRKGRIVSFDNFITKEGLENSSAKLFPVGTVLVAMYGATAGQIGFLEKESSTNQAICGLLPNSNIYPDFLYFLLSTKTKELLSLGTGAAQPNISQEIIRDYDVFIPSSVEEQEAITKIIAAADQEIIKLEKKLKLIKCQKKYLINNLITGTIRTPESLLIHK